MPCPTIDSTATSARKLTCRNGSRVAGSERWTSQNGRSTPSSASRSATDVWVRPPALTIATSKSRWWSRSISAPSWFDWKKSTVEAELRRPGRDLGVDVVERVVAVDLRLARAEQVQVRALEDEDAGHAAAPAAGRRSAAGGARRRRRSTSSSGRPTGLVRRRPSAGPSAGARRRASCRSPGGRATARAGRGAARAPSPSASAGARSASARSGGVTPSSTPIRARRRAARTRPPRRGAARR